MPIPLAALALVALPFIGGAAGKAKSDPMPLLLGAGALFLLSKWGLGDLFPKVNIVPEVKEFSSAVMGGGRKGKMAEDQSGSPNPPTEDWWGVYSGSVETAGWLPREARGPIPVAIGTAVPTAPIVEQSGPPSQAHLAGQQTHRWFTNPKFYPWFALADKL